MHGIPCLEFIYFLYFCTTLLFHLNLPGRIYTYNNPKFFYLWTKEWADQKFILFSRFELCYYNRPLSGNIKNFYVPNYFLRFRIRPSWETPNIIMKPIRIRYFLQILSSNSVKIADDINLFDKCWVKFQCFCEYYQLGNTKIWPEECQKVKYRRLFLFTLSKIEFDTKKR